MFNIASFILSLLSVKGGERSVKKYGQNFIQSGKGIGLFAGHFHYNRPAGAGTFMNMPQGTVQKIISSVIIRVKC